MSTVVRVTAVIISFNVREALRRCLHSLSEVDEVVVVDNASDDASADLVTSEFPHVHLVRLAQNRGFGPAVNLAAMHAHGDALLLVNPDAVLPAGAVAHMRQRLAEWPQATAIGFRHVDQQGHFQLSVGPPASLCLALVRRFVQRRLDRGSQWLAALIDRLLARPRRVPWVAASLLLVRRHAFAAVSGFDERFFLYFEDVDLCLRLRAAGGEVVYDPSITVTHERGASVKVEPELAGRAYRESQLYFWRKHRGAAAAWLVEQYLRLRGLGPAHS
ncbi:MAG: glycosyltransferase family 2 protein [Deltaproteobacteria bacterium]|nr:glycosyltransferase family 2 protein [Deltaproteobacteria bacterium]